jgi:DNA/RNA endonuclease YhcR with UshA esterase domain
VVGVVTGFVANNTFAIQDETGAIAVFVVTTANRDIWIPYIGKTVDLIGTRTQFNGLQQIRFITAVVGEETPMPFPVNIDGITSNSY